MILIKWIPDLTLESYYQASIGERVELAAQAIALENDYWENMKIAVTNGIAKAFSG